jgi:hypothetical protein
VDDASADGTGAILDAIAEALPGVAVIHAREDWGPAPRTSSRCSTPGTLVRRLHHDGRGLSHHPVPRRAFSRRSVRRISSQGLVTPRAAARTTDPAHAAQPHANLLAKVAGGFRS